MNSFGQEVVVHNARVDILCEYGRIGTGSVNDGMYAVVVEHYTCAYVVSRVWVENPAAQVRAPGTFSNYFADVTDPYPLDSDGDGLHLMPDGLVAEQYRAAGLFGIGWLWDVRSYFVSRFGWTQDRETAYLPNEAGPYYAYGIFCLDSFIAMPTSRMWVSGTWVHEYGHGIMHRAYGCNVPPSPDHGEPHDYNTEYDGGFALTEGWGDFLAFFFVAGLADNDAEQSTFNPVVHWEDGVLPYGGRFNGDEFIFDGNDVEGAIFGILTDLEDNTPTESIGRHDRDGNDVIDVTTPTEDEPFEWLGVDSLQSRLDDVWSIIRYDHPDDLRDFWFHWFSTIDNTPSNYGSAYELKSIFYDHGIRDTDGDGLSDNIAPYFVLGSFSITSQPGPSGFYRGSVDFRALVIDLDPEDSAHLDVHFVQVPDEEFDTCSQPSVTEFDRVVPAISGEYAIGSWDTVASLVPDGTYFVCGEVDDGMQISYTPSALGLILDNTPPGSPVLTESHTGGSWSNHNTPFFTWTNPGDPDLSYYERQLDGGLPEIDFGQDIHLLIPDGTHSFRVRAVDTTGNEGFWSNTVYVYIDTMPPELSLMFNCPATTLEQRPPLDWSAFGDPGPSSGLKWFHLELDAGSSFTPPLTVHAHPSVDFLVPQSLEPGPYVWRVRAEDNAGNLALWPTPACSLTVQPNALGAPVGLHISRLLPTTVRLT